MTRRVLLTGATGFVGRALAPRLVDAGWRVRGLTRHLRADAAPSIEWFEGDIQKTADDARALEGVEVAVYLVHAMTEGKDFERREVDEAGRFATAAREAGVSRIVYLGGIAPGGRPRRTCAAAWPWERRCAAAPSPSPSCAQA